MPQSADTTADLQEQVDRLKRRLDRNEKHLRATVTACRSLLETHARVPFTAHLQPSGVPEAVNISQPDSAPPGAAPPLSPQALLHLLHQPPGPARCRSLLREQQPVVFEASLPSASGVTPVMSEATASSGSRAHRWRVHLSPPEGSPPEDETASSEGVTSVEGFLHPVPPQCERAASSASMPPSVLDVVRSHGAPADAFSCLAEHMAEPVLLLDESGDIVFANNAASHLLGTDHPHDVTGQRLTADFLERDAVDFQRGGASDRSAVATEHRLHRADGTTLPVQIATVPLRRNGTTLTLATLHGIQKRRRLSTTLHRTLDLFHKVFHLGPAALMLVRLRDGVILEVSKQLLDLGGFSADALLGHTIHDALGAFYEGDYRAIARKLLRARRLRNQELRVSGTKGKERVLLGGARLVDVDGAACALLSLVDITERKAALEAERESRAKADHIFQASPAPLGIYRLADGQLLEANEALGTLLGYDRDALFEHAWSAVWADGDAHAALVERLRAEESVHDFKTNLQHASGKAVTVLGSFQRLSLDGVECVLMAMTDVTSREEARQALVDAKEKAEEAQRKSEEVAVFRSSVLANITHEVRTPLTTILGFTSVLHNGVDDRYKRFVRLIERSGNRLLLMLDSLLDLAQLEAGTMTMPLKPQCVQDVLHALSSPLQTRVEEEGLAFRLQVPTDERVCARLNEDLMSRVLTYLVDNAVKFTSEGHVALRMTATDTTVDVRVEDTGPGMAATFLPRAFDAFAQESEGSARDHQGSGLGLTVSRRIMEYMGGTIRIDTEKEKGTTIVLRLQRTEGCEPKLS